MVVVNTNIRNTNKQT